MIEHPVPPAAEIGALPTDALARADDPALTHAHWLRATPAAVLVLDTSGCILGCSDAAAALLGRDPEELAGVYFPAAACGAAERGGAQQVVDHVLANHGWHGELRLTAAPGEPLVQVQGAPFGDLDRLPRDPGLARAPGAAAPTAGMVVVLQELRRARHRARLMAERFTRLARVAAELQAVADVRALTDVVVSHLADAAEATGGSLSILLDDRTLAMVGVRGGTKDAETQWATYRADDSTPAGTAVVSRRPVLLIGRQEITRRYPDLELAAPGERSLLCFPLVVGDRAVGVASLSFPSRRELDQTERDFLQAMADTCAQALERIRATERVAEQTAKLTLIAQASNELASSLDYESTLRNVARLAVPGFADWCTISLDQDGALRTLAVAHRDPQKVALAEEFQRRFPVDPEHSSNHQVVRTGESLLVPEVTEKMLATASQGPEHLDMLRRLSLSSLLAVALQARGRIFGAITWIRSADSLPFTEADRVFGEDLARRAATAIDNSQLHSELRHVADRLHEAVLPPALPAVPGWQLSSSYLSAGRAGVGGDFFDVLPLDGGRLALVIGDVMGRGVEAAAAMSQVRAALRTVVADEPDPASVLTRLDRFFERYPTEQLVTLLYAVADPARDRLELASAGHPPPLLIDAAGRSRFLPVRGRILGVAPAARRATTVALSPGDTILLFTDGLLERRGEDLRVSRRRLRRAVETLSPDRPDQDLATLATQLPDPTREDDVALLMARRLPTVG